MADLRRWAKTMAAKLEITAGLDVWKSSSIMSEVYWEVSRFLSEKKNLRRWLADVSKRPAPFLDISLSGLSPEHRQDFVMALRLAHETEDRPVVKMALREIDEAIRLAESRDLEYTLRPITGAPEDTDQIWSPDSKKEEPNGGVSVMAAPR